LPDVTSDAVCAALLQLQRLLHVEAGEASPEGLQRAHAMLESCVLPALAELAKQQQRQQAGEQQQEQQRQEPQQQQPDVPLAAAGMDGAGGGSGGTAQQAAAAAMLAQYPLGFSTGDGAADLAATILRMLYIKDLRALQVSNCSARCRCWLPLPAAAGCRCRRRGLPPHGRCILSCRVVRRQHSPSQYPRAAHPLLPGCPTPFLHHFSAPTLPADAGGLSHCAGAGIYSQPAHRHHAWQGRQVTGGGLPCAWQLLRPARHSLAASCI
jgi:hypothetical protein